MIQDNDGKTALALAIEGDGKGRAGCAECVALLRAALAKVEGEEEKAEAGELYIPFTDTSLWPSSE